MLAHDLSILPLGSKHIFTAWVGVSGGFPVSLGLDGETKRQAWIQLLYPDPILTRGVSSSALPTRYVVLRPGWCLKWQGVPFGFLFRNTHLVYLGLYCG